MRSVPALDDAPYASRSRVSICSTGGKAIATSNVSKLVVTAPEARVKPPTVISQCSGPLPDLRRSNRMRASVSAKPGSRSSLRCKVFPSGKPLVANARPGLPAKSVSKPELSLHTAPEIAASANSEVISNPPEPSSKSNWRSVAAAALLRLRKIVVEKNTKTRKRRVARISISVLHVVGVHTWIRLRTRGGDHFTRFSLNRGLIVRVFSVLDVEV